MAEFTFAEIMRTGHVKRWQIVRVAREQTIAEHMYRVWLITAAICQNLRMPHTISASANVWALIHDMPEVLTGDIATPAKEAMRKALPDDDPVRNIELSMSDTYRTAHADAKTRFDDIRPTAYELVKLADLIEAKCFLGCEMMGNHAKSVYDGIATKVDSTYADYQVRYPLVDWPAIRFLINNSWEKV
jgi:5'-deoxynucleotidase YfbR-like HD superfamily hydrolase